jgi:hypothetical protein
MFYNNTFIYSPTSQVYAAGMLNNQFGIYKAYGCANVNSTTSWIAPQTSTSSLSHLALQTDRNLVVYGSNITDVMLTAAVNNGGIGLPFCLEMLDSGNLIWVDNTSTIIWQTNSTQNG